MIGAILAALLAAIRVRKFVELVEHVYGENPTVVPRGRFDLYSEHGRFMGSSEWTFTDSVGYIDVDDLIVQQAGRAAMIKIYMPNGVHAGDSPCTNVELGSLMSEVGRVACPQRESLEFREGERLRFGRTRLLHTTKCHKCGSDLEADL